MSNKIFNKIRVFLCECMLPIQIFGVGFWIKGEYLDIRFLMASMLSRTGFGTCITVV